MKQKRMEEIKLGYVKENKMVVILKGKNEERFVVDNKTAHLIKSIIQKERQNKSLDFMLKNAGKLKDLNVSEEDIYMQGDK